MNAHAVTLEYRFSGYTLDVRQRKLLNPDGASVALSSRAFDTLLVLLEKRGETLSKSQIMQAVWPNAVVEENNLNQAISSLRKALGDSKSENNFILTVPGRGYCFVAPVAALASPQAGATAVATPAEPVPETAATPTQAPVTRATLPGFPLLPVAAGLVLLLVAGELYLFRGADSAAEAVTVPVVQAAAEPVPVPAADDLIRNSIAVLPFTTLNPDADNALFALGLHDEVINQLTKIHSLNVIGRDSVLALVDQQLALDAIGRKLRVETMMSGTILFAGEQARISLQMLDAATGVMLWAETYEAKKQDLAEMMSIQSDIAVHVASALQAEIEQSEQATIAAVPTQSFAAYRYNLAAKNAHFQQDFAQEWELSRQAMELDPNYFDALFTFSSVNTVMVAVPLQGMTSSEHFALALDSAERMIEIAPSRSEGYALKAVALSTNKDWAGVSAVLDTLDRMQVPPSELKYIALILLCQGDFDRAISIYEANLVTEPVNLYGRGFLMAALEVAGKREQARAEYAIGQELSPVWWGDTVNIFLALGRHEPLQDVGQLVGISDALKTLLLHADDSERVKAGLQAYRGSVNRVPAETVYYGALAAHVGEHELAVDLMRSALTDVWTGMYWLWLPVFDETRRLENFKNLLRESGLVDYWQQHGWPEVCQPEGESFTCEWRAYAGEAAGV